MNLSHRASLLALLVISLDGGVLLAQQPAKWKAVNHARRTIYHSPDKPGYTCWVGAWIMPDRDLMVCFTQATGPLKDRERAPKEIQRKLDWPPGNINYDMTGLDLRNVHLRSGDGGTNWKQVSADPFKSCMNGVTGECETALKDGTILRGVFGLYLPYDRDVPQTGFLQRSSDGSKTWGKPEVLLDPEKVSTWPRRLRQLRDGRLLLVGGLMRESSKNKTRNQLGVIIEPLLLVSGDNGKTWTGPLDIVRKEDRGGFWTEEWDVAELPSGDLLAVFRRPDPKTKKESRWQGVLKKQDAVWVLTKLRAAPFPHSGHPELLLTREGPILHVATSGIDWTADAGETWHHLAIPGSAYYPRSVQTTDGKIHVFAHIGSDDPYGSRDQSIVMDSFGLEPE